MITMMMIILLIMITAEKGKMGVNKLRTDVVHNLSISIELALSRFDKFRKSGQV